MSLKVGIVGLPNVGKSTLFNALLKKRVALSANYPFATIEPNMGVVAVPDQRLTNLGLLVQGEEHMESMPPIIPAVVEFVDIAGLVKGASTGAGLGNQFLSHIREVDAIIHILRDFKDENIVREGSVSPKEDKGVIETELALADLQVIEKLILGQDKQTRTTHDPLDQNKLDILNEIRKVLENGEVGKIAEIGETQDERIKEWFGTLPLLTTKPVLYVYNVSENELKEKSEELKNQENALAISAKLEEELADYSESERLEYLKTLGIEQTGLERLIKKTYDLLGLISFLTAGKKEVRAWTIKKGTKAPLASGVIHTDFIKKFIRAEVIEYGKLIEADSYAKAKEKGLIRTEGKEYIVKDGDIIEFLIGS